MVFKKQLWTWLRPQLLGSSQVWFSQQGELDTSSGCSWEACWQGDFVALERVLTWWHAAVESRLKSGPLHLHLAHPTREVLPLTLGWHPWHPICDLLPPCTCLSCAYWVIYRLKDQCHLSALSDSALIYNKPLPQFSGWPQSALLTGGLSRGHSCQRIHLADY